MSLDWGESDAVTVDGPGEFDSQSLLDKSFVLGKSDPLGDMHACITPPHAQSGGAVICMCGAQWHE